MAIGEHGGGQMLVQINPEAIQSGCVVFGRWLLGLFLHYSHHFPLADNGKAWGEQEKLKNNSLSL
jgi:hypothetical protein